MGADLLLAHTRAPHLSEGPDFDAAGERSQPVPSTELILRTAKERVQSWLDRQHHADLVSILEGFGFDYDDIVQREPDEDAPQGESDDAHTSRVHSLVLEWVEHELTQIVASSDPRDVISLAIDRKAYWFTGGLSWGDSPTDSYEFIEFLGEVGVFDQPILKEVSA